MFVLKTIPSRSLAQRYQQNYLDYRHELTLLECSATALSAEIDTISEALGGEEGITVRKNINSIIFRR